MKGFNDTRFANIFGRIHMALNPGLQAYRWEAEGVAWSRDRHSHHGPHYSYQCEAFVLERRAALQNPWLFLYVAETWWDRDGKNVLRSTAWGKVMKGRKPDVIAWMKIQAEKLERQTKT